MAIQMRRGNYADYDESKIRPGEWAVATDAERVFIGVASGAVEMAKKSDVDAMAESAEEAILDAKAKALATIYGSLPTTVSTVAQMVDHDLTYIYSGSETGYTAGHWYYWDGSAWTDGGQYVDKSKTNAPIIYNTASGAIASFSDGADDYPIKGLTVAVEPVQSGSGDPSPSNIRPISGFSEVKVTRTGQNLLNTDLTYPFTYRGITVEKNANGSLHVTGAYTSTGNGTLSLTGAMHLPDGDLVISGMPSTSLSTYGARLQVLDVGVGDIAYEGGSGASFTAEHGHTYTIRLFFTGATAYGLSVDYTIYPMIRLASDTDATYEPYQGDTYTISLGDTVYGGTLDVVGGKMVVDRAIIDLGYKDWATLGSSYQYGTFWTVSALDNAKYASATPLWVCDRYKAVATNAGTSASGDNYIWIRSSGGNKIVIKDTSKSSMSASEFKAAMSGVPFVYTLETPIEISLTPTQINTLLGNNNVYSDAGDVSVEYPADTKRFILNSIASALA